MIDSIIEVTEVRGTPLLTLTVHNTETDAVRTMAFPKPTANVEEITNAEATLRKLVV